jgi:parallel beta-helix repeat protein
VGESPRSREPKGGKIKAATLLLASVAITLLAFAAPASATHVQCGDTITATVVLDGDVTCGDGNNDVGLLLREHGITVRLNGFAIRAGGNGGWAGIRQSRFPIRNLLVEGPGRIEGFREGISLHAHETTVRGVTIAAGSTGISLSGSGTQPMGASPCEPHFYGNVCVSRNIVTVDGPGGVGISVPSNDAHVWGNRVGTNLGTGIRAGGDRPRVVRNTIVGCGPISPRDDAVRGISAVGYQTFAMISQNNAGGCGIGIYAQAAVGGGGVRIRRNVATGNLDGLNVDDPSALIWRNTANSNFWNGIFVHQAGTVVQENTANDNGSFGINATPGVIDGGGNTATGNGDGRLPQCHNVSCGP